MSHFGRSRPPDVKDTFSLVVLNFTFTIEKQKPSVVRTEPVLLEGSGNAYWKLRGCCHSSNILLQDKWFIYNEEEEKMIEQVLSPLRNWISFQGILFGHFNKDIKMVAGDSTGTVIAFYLSSQNSEHDEIDFEFLGNRRGQPYILQTNVFTDGKGNKE